MKKLSAIAILCLLIIFTITPVSTLASNSSTIVNDNNITLVTAINENDLGLCDCNTTFYKHNQIFNNLTENDVTTKTLICDCGNTLLSKVSFKGNWIYDRYENCYHGKHGVDYIYKSQIITSYKCSSCSFYQELKIYQYDTRCNGV